LTQGDFERVLMSAVDEGLCLLGDSPRQAILFHLETSFQLKRENIPSSLTEFQKALEGMLGPGATYIEKAIVRHLHEKLGLSLTEEAETGFLKSVEMAKTAQHQKE
jgi:hypothetical protein